MALGEITVSNKEVHTMADNSMDENIFVYGTLRSTEHNHDVLRSMGAVFLGNDSIKGEVVRAYGLPCLREGLGLVEGERYAVSKFGLQRLDYFESHPTGYERRSVETINGNKVWVYFANEILRGYKEERVQ